MSDPTAADPLAAVRIAYDRDHDVGEAALRGMQIELTSLLTEGLQDVWALLVAGIEQSGYRDTWRTWRWRVGCRLLERLEQAWPPELADEREILLLLERTKRFLNRTAASAEPPTAPERTVRVRSA